LEREGFEGGNSSSICGYLLPSRGIRRTPIFFYMGLENKAEGRG